MSNQLPLTSTGSSNVTERFASRATSVAPSRGEVVWTAGASSIGDATTPMSSMPTHSSLPVAFVVMIRTWTTAWSLAAAGRTTSTGVTRLARSGPDVASATKPAGRLVYVPVVPTRYWTATGCTALSAVPSMSRRTYDRSTFESPTVLRTMTTFGASAVLVPWSATTGFPIWNSATPP